MRPREPLLHIPLVSFPNWLKLPRPSSLCYLSNHHLFWGGLVFFALSLVVSLLQCEEAQGVSGGCCIPASSLHRQPRALPLLLAVPTDVSSLRPLQATPNISAVGDLPLGPHSCRLAYCSGS